MTPVPESLGGTAIETVKRGWTTTGHPNPPQPRVIELRVHGVSGTPPESLLLSPKEFVYRCYGDGDSGFYRRRFRLRLNDAQAPGSDGDFDVDDNHEETEAFSWGGLTSGPSSRALWLLFFPFILINLAHWMLPPTRRPWFGAASVALLRLLGLTVTLTMLSTAVLLLVDLVGWQCSGMATCAAQLGPFKFLGTLTRGPATSVTALPIAVLVGTLLFIGRANPRLGDPPPHPAEAAPGASPLSRPTFWNADPSVTRLRHCHVAAWFAGLGALVLIAPVQTTTGAAQCGAAALVAVDVLILITTVGLTAWNGVTARGGDGFGNGATIATKTLRWIALITLLLALVLVACTDDTHRRLTGSPGPLPGLGLVIIGLFTAQVILLTLLLLGIWLSKAAPSTEPNRRPSLRGFTGWFVAAMAWLSAGGISIGAAIWLARFLGTPTVGAQAAVKDDAPIVLPAICQVGALALLALLLAVLVAGGCVAVGACREARRQRRYIVRSRAYPPVPDKSRKDLQHRRIKSIAWAIAWARVTDSAPSIVAGLVCFTIVDVAVSFVAVGHSWPSETALNRSMTWGQGLATAALAAFVGLAYKAFRQRNTRRGVGVLWDVMTFWPQAAHPLGPPCYGERAVPDLRDRVQNLSEASRVVLACHSQGSIIGAAALLLPKAVAGDPGSAAPLMTSDSIALLTFGSPLHRLYGRNFPAYFDFDTLEQLRAAGPGRWLNLWAYSDPIGGWVFHGGRARISAPGGWMHRPATPDPTTVDLWLPDATGALPKQGSYPPICHHSGFWLRPEYEWAVDRLAARIAVIPGRIGTVAGLVNLIEPRTAPSASVPEPLRLPSAAE